MADDVWIYDLKTGAIENLTDNPAQDICPMWGPDNKIYFLSDRDGRLNLFVSDLATRHGNAKQLTNFKDFDAKFPSIGQGLHRLRAGGLYLAVRLGEGAGRAGADHD